MRLLDIGGDWGSLALHAAARYGASVTAVTISFAQAAPAARRVSDARMSGRVEIRLQDYREVADGPFVAISSIGMAEHVGLAQLPLYAARRSRSDSSLVTWTISGMSPPGYAAARIVPLPPSAGARSIAR